MGQDKGLSLIHISVGAEQNLAPSFFPMVNVPVVAAARFKGYVLSLIHI